MEALVAWYEEKKKCLALFVVIVFFLILLLPDELKGIGIVIGGLAWHFGNAETASLYWLSLGFSPNVSQAFAVLGGMLISLVFCMIGFRLKILRLSKVHTWLVSHPWVAKLPYPGIVVFGLLLPVGGLITGIFIARNADLKKTPAALTILGINLIKLLGMGKILTHFLSPLL